MELITIILAIWVVVLTFRVKNQGSALDEVQKTLSKFRVVKKDTATDAQPVAKPMASAVTEHSVSEPTPVEEPVQAPEPTPQEPKESFEQLLVKKILPNVGVISVFLGVGFLVTWSYTNGWLGPKGLISLGVVLSLGLMVAGEKLRHTYERYYAFLTTAGLLGLSTCVYSSHEYYKFITDNQAQLLYVVVAVIGIALAFRYSHRAISGLAMFIAVVSPLVVDSQTPNVSGLMMYVSVALVIAVLIYIVRGWYATLLIALGGLIVYAGMMLDGIKLTDSPYAVDPYMYLVWLYSSLAIFAGSLVYRAIQTSKDIDSDKLSISGSATIVIVLFTMAIVNFYGFVVFTEMDWDAFGFFVLAQGALMYGVSLLCGQKNLGVLQQLFTVGALTSIAFATVWEIGFDGYPMMTTLLFAVQSAMFMYVYHTTRNQVSGVYKFFGFITQFIALCGLTFVDGFTELTICIAVLVALSLFNARVLFESNTSDSHISKGVWIQLILAFGMFMVWNYMLLFEEMTRPGSLILPYVIGAGATAGLLTLWVMRKHAYLAHTACLLAVCNAFHFVISAYGHADIKIVLFGFLASLAALYAPFGFSRLMGQTENGIASESYEQIVTFSSVGCAAMLVWFGYWWFSEPITTVFIMMIGGLYVLTGLHKQVDVVRTTGLVVIGLVVAKLYIIDIWLWSTFWKMAALLPMGALLISLPFWYQKLTKSEE